MSWADARFNEMNANSYIKAELDERLEDIKADKWWLKKHFGEHIKITGNLVFAKTPEDFLKEIDRQNQKLKEGNTQ